MDHKNKKKNSDYGWYSTVEDFDGLMEARNTRPSVSLHSELEAFISEIECLRNLQQFLVTIATDYFQLMKMVLKPDE